VLAVAVAEGNSETNALRVWVPVAVLLAATWKVALLETARDAVEVCGDVTLGV